MRTPVFATLLAMLACTAPAAGQLLGGGGLGGAVGGLTGGLTGAGPGGTAVVGGLSAPLTEVGGVVQSASSSDLLSLRRERLRGLLQTNRSTLEDDGEGNPVRRDEIIGIGLGTASIEALRAAGYKIASRDAVDGLGLPVTVLTPPKGKSARKALADIQKLDPAGSYTLDPIYEPARAPLGASQAPTPRSDGSAKGTRIGLIDGGVGGHPVFAGASIEQKGFAGDPKVSGHGTAVASLIIGNSGAFHGAAPGGTLLVADVYCGAPGNGSALAIVRAMAWLASKGVRVINVSLVGPPNPLLEAGVNALQAKGIMVVAAVGNDGPAAPPQYPASYPGVIAVTGVDAKGKALIEAGRALHVDFAAPGADMAGAIPGGGWEDLRGTSFAAPLVAGRLALLGDVDRLAAEAQPGGGKIGRGIVCGECRIPPRAVGIK